MFGIDVKDWSINVRLFPNFTFCFWKFFIRFSYNFFKEVAIVVYILVVELVVLRCIFFCFFFFFKLCFVKMYTVRVSTSVNMIVSMSNSLIMLLLKVVRFSKGDFSRKKLFEMFNKLLSKLKP
jgi:hypothetical protein